VTGRTGRALAGRDVIERPGVQRAPPPRKNTTESAAPRRRRRVVATGSSPPHESRFRFRDSIICRRFYFPVLLGPPSDRRPIDSEAGSPAPGKLSSP